MEPVCVDDWLGYPLAANFGMSQEPGITSMALLLLCITAFMAEHDFRGRGKLREGNMAKPFLFYRVSWKIVYNCFKDDNFFIVVLPSPHCCLLLLEDCACIFSFLFAVMSRQIQDQIRESYFRKLTSISKHF